MRRGQVLLATAAVMVAASACGGSSGSSPTSVGARNSAYSHLVLVSATKTEHAGSAHVAFTVQGAAPGGRTVRLAGTGAVNMSQRTAELRFKLPATVGGGALTEIAHGFMLYLHSPKLSQRLPSGKVWAAINLEQAAAQRGINLPALQNTTQNDPTQALAYLTGVSNSVVRIGTARIRGVPTTQYRAIVDLAKVPAREPAGLRAQSRQTTTKMIALLHRSTFPVDVWIDHQGRVRRETFGLPLPGGTQITLTTSIELYDFGAPVHITPPSPNQTVNLLSLLPTAR